MEIKVIYQGQVIGEVAFMAFTVIEKMKKLGYESFWVRSQVCKYEYFATFKNEITEEYINFYPNKSFMKGYDCKVSYEELDVIKDILEHNITYKPIEEEDD